MLKSDCAEALKTIDIHQSIIVRMAAACSTAKNWCVTIVSAAAALAIEKQNSAFALIAIIPTVLFMLMDIYYLSMERAIRKTHKVFIKNLREGTATNEELFDAGSFDLTFNDTCAAVRSKSIWPFYLLILLCLALVGIITNGCTTPIIQK